MCPVGVRMAGGNPAESDHGVCGRGRGPNVTPAAEPGSLWAQAGHWIWNAPGNDWPLPVSTGDSSGVCSLSVQVGASPPIADSSLPGAEQFQLAGVSAAGELDGGGRHARLRWRRRPATRHTTGDKRSWTADNASTSETLNVDNDPVGVSLSTPNDPNPTVWVNHAVTVDATPSTGPSGLGGMTAMWTEPQRRPIRRGADRRRRRSQDCGLHGVE